MTTQQIQRRLLAAQSALIDALDTEDHERLPPILLEREPDLVALVGRIPDDPALREWARGYLDRDREILARAQVARDAAADRLNEIRHQRSVHRIYISEGVRR